MRPAHIAWVFVIGALAFGTGCKKKEEAEKSVTVVVPPAVAPEVAKGGEIFRQKCVVCHKVGGSGGTLSSDLTKVGERHDAVYLQTLLKDPTLYYPKDVRMPSFKDLPKEDMDALITYLLTLK